MKITICGSIAFYDEMQKMKQKLESLGHKVKLPPSEIKDNNGKIISPQKYYELRKLSNPSPDSWIWKRKAEIMRDYFNEVVWADAILVLNYKKNNIEGYIGANTLLEMGLAFHLKKKIYLLNSVPEISYKEEILAMQPIVINNNLNLIQ